MRPSGKNAPPSTGAIELGAGHSHGESPAPSTVGRMALSSALFGVSFLLQGLGGLWTGSLGLISDSLENLNDVLVNLMGIASLVISHRRDPCDKYAYGWHRLEVFNTLVGVGFLLALGTAVGWEAFHRFRNPVVIQTGWVLVFAGVGLALNVGAALVLRPSEPGRLERDSSLKAAYLHASADALTSVALVGSMLVIRLTGWRWVDPAIALGILAVILRGAYGLLRDSLQILMHRAAFDHDAARAELLRIPGVSGVEDLRSWRICSHLTVCTAHIIVQAEQLEETVRFQEDAEHVLKEHFGVRHLTLHFETARMAERHHHRFIHQHETRNASPEELEMAGSRKPGSGES